MSEIKLNLGPKIKLLREMRGISQEAVAMDLGISQQAFQQIEAGKTRINLDRANQIAQCFELELEALLAFQPANYLSNCTQSGVYNINNFLNEKLFEQLENQNATLKAELEFLRQQNRDLMELLKKREGN